MSRIKRSISVLLIAGLLLGNVASARAANDNFRPDNEDLYLGALENIVETKYNTIAVTKGDFEAYATSQAYIVYDKTSYVFNTISQGTVKFGQYFVKNGDFVKKGDPIAEITVTAELESIEDLTNRITTMEENLESYANVNKGLLKKYTSIINSNVESPVQKKIAQLLYNRLDVDYKKEYSRRSAELNALKVQLAETENLVGTQYIKAPADGVVNNLQHFWPDSKLNNYTYMCNVVDNTKAKIYINSNSDLLRYNMPVKIVQSNGPKSVSLDGRVVTLSSTTLSPNLTSGQPIVEILGDPSLLDISNDVSVRFTSITAKNVILVSKKAVSTDAKGDFVYLYRDGHSFKQYIITGGNNATDYWVVSGLNEGDLVVVK